MSEKVLYEQVVKAFRDLGFDVIRLAQPRRSMVDLGLPDLYARYARGGRAARFWVEVKTPQGVVSDWQRLWHEAERAAGGEVYVVRSVDQVIQIARRWGVPVQITA